MKFAHLFVAICSLALACLVCATDRPIVGVLTQDCSFNKGKQYIAAGYVKWLEAGGARVVPLKYDMEGLNETLKYINGVLLPGGGGFEPTQKYANALITIFEHTVNSFNAGNPFPLWGTCLGFEEIVILASQNTSTVESGFDSEDLALPLILKNTAMRSRLFSDMPETMIKEIQMMNLIYNNHVRGVTPDKFSPQSALGKFFYVLSVNTDRKGKMFVSTIEGRVYPVWGTQWHPEKVSFEWKEDLLIPHSSSAVSVNMYPVKFFVDQCRNNKNKFPSSSLEQQSLIYNYKAEDTRTISHFEQCYIF